MSQYRSNMTPEQFDALKNAALELGADGPFDANDFLKHVVVTGVANNAGDVATALDDLADLGYLTAEQPGGGPSRYRLAAEAAP